MVSLKGIVFAAVCLVASGVQAQGQTGQTRPTEQAPGGPQQGAQQTQRTGGIETMTITAEKRESPLQETPVAVSAFSGAQLQTLSIETSQDIAVFTPGLVSSKASNTNNSLALFGRGVGAADNNPLVDPKVGLYVDGAYNSQGHGSMFNLFDIERVEVLRGPQGTLYGRNTTGGAINIITRKPGPEFGYKASALVGSYGQLDVKGTLNVPLIGESLLGRFSFARTQHQPFYENKFPGGDDYDDNDAKGFRAALRWLTTEDLTVDYTFDWIDTDEHDPLFMLQTTCASACIQGFVGPTQGLQAGLATMPIYIRQHKGDTFNDGDMFNRFDIKGHAIDAQYELTQDVMLKSITTWRSVNWKGANDLDGTPFNLFHSGVDSKSHNFMEELQLIGSALDTKFEYVMGANWYQQIARDEAFSDQFIDCPNCTAGFPTSQTSGTDFNNYAYAGFGQFTYHLTDKLSATGGVRYTTERKRVEYDLCAGDPSRTTANQSGRVFENCVLAIAPTPAQLTDADFAARFNGWSPMARLAYDWTEALMTYVTWARGYQAGGFSPRPSGAALALTTAPFDEENLFSWEAGMKARWFANQLETNIAGYYNKFKDQQITTFVPGSGTATVINNAGESRIRGYEIELTGAPNMIPGLLVKLTHDWTNAEFVEFIGVDNFGNPADLADIRNFGHIPKRKYSGLVSYSFAPQDWGELVLTGTFAREGPKSWLGIPIQDAATKSSSYTRYDARIDLNNAFGMEGVRLSAIGKNLSDRNYDCCQGIDFGFWQAGGFGNPRQLQFEVGYEFGGI
jgi:iron complex outermembrane receptor protein